MNHSIILTDIAVILLLVLVMRRTRAKPQPAIHVHPCVMVATPAELAEAANKVDAIVRDSAE